MASPTQVEFKGYLPSHRPNCHPTAAESADESSADKVMVRFAHHHFSAQAPSAASPAAGRHLACDWPIACSGRLLPGRGRSFMTSPSCSAGLGRLLRSLTCTTIHPLDQRGLFLKSSRVTWLGRWTFGPPAKSPSRGVTCPLRGPQALYHSNRWT